MSKFRINADDFQWICGYEDDPEDKCLHGRVTIQIGEISMVEYGTVSATALYLLKTLTEDKLMTDHEIQMVPCCGHFYIANEDLTEVSILGCDTGLDWSTVHEENCVRLIFKDGTEATIPMDQYREEVFKFADKVEAYYASCLPKKVPTNEFDRNGYLAFWNEWKRRRGN